ncbi:MAG TPA: acetylglutamate kinase [Dehalococcoidia bacterium]|nr:acetylglutamate kinase [Dehalococcoidia bacterium]
MSEIIVAKIGGSTLASHDTSLEDVAALHARGDWPVIVHGGGVLISDWLKRLAVPTKFERGLRVTDAASLEVVVAVLCGLVNKTLVASLQALGARALGLSGADGSLLQAKVRDEALGFVGEISAVDPTAVLQVIATGAVPVIAPVGMEYADGKPTGQLLNINADTSAGAIAAAIGAARLVFMTDVPGVKSNGAVLEALSATEAHELMSAGVIEGGMIPKVEACLQAAAAGCRADVVDGREEHALLAVIDGKNAGTTVG